MLRKQIWLISIASILGGFIGGLLFSFLFAGESASAKEALSNPQIVSANEFRLIDDVGAVRAALGFGGTNAPSLTLFDTKQTPRIRLTLAEDNETPAIGLIDKNGRPRLVMVSGDSGQVGLSLLGEDGQVRVTISRENDDTSILTFSNAGAKYRIKFLASKGGSGLFFIDKSGNPTAILSAVDSEDSSISLRSKEGRVWSVPSYDVPGRTWVLWGILPGDQFQAVALAVWPTQRECNAERDRRLQNIKTGMVCLPDNVNPIRR